MKATYKSEGDGPLSFMCCYEIIDSLFYAIQSAHCPNSGCNNNQPSQPSNYFRTAMTDQVCRRCVQPQAWITLRTRGH